MARITAVCISRDRGTRKEPVQSAVLIRDHGIQGDGHAGEGPRQLSILSDLSLQKMRSRGIDACHGCCGQNMDIDAEVHTLVPGTRLKLGDEAVVTVTAIGKNNEDGHADRVIEGNIFPEEGLFASVDRDGPVSPGDQVSLLRERGFSVGILTVSDSACAGVYSDLTGPALMEDAAGNGLQPCRYAVVPDEEELIEEKLKLWCDDGFLDLVFTAGGTGLSTRDVTPEATLNVMEREVPGIPEMVRQKSSAIVVTAWLSRARAGIRKRTLIINLPGSRKASLECAGFIYPVLDHALKILRGDVQHCGDHTPEDK